MISKIYCVYDSKAETYSPPMLNKTKAEALRDFATAANNPQTLPGKFPEDFTLFELGAYNDQNASFELHPTAIALGKAIEYVQKN